MTDLNALIERVDAVARIDAMGVQPERSDTFHYQAAGYSQGWHAAIAAYRQGIRKLASLTSAPAQGGGEPDLIDQHFAAIAIASSIGGKKGWDWLRKYESGDDEHVAQARAFDGRAFAAPSPAPVSAPLRGEEHRIRDWLLKRHADHLSASADNRLMMRREFGDAEMFLDTAILLSELSRAAALSSPATPEPVSAPAGEVAAEAIRQIGQWHLDQKPNTGAMSESFARDLMDRWHAQGRAVQKCQHILRALSNAAPGHEQTNV